MYQFFFKRLMDFTAALLMLLCLSPLLVVVWLWLTWANKGAGALFFQERPGFRAKVFRIVKFKTMTDERDAAGNLLPDAARLTRAGRFVRSTSIDELPQLINVLKGDMSFIGPRPLLIQYLPLYSTEQARRHEVRPGMSGWAQVNGRNLCLLSKKFEYDVFYVNNISFLLDLKIACLTVKKVFIKKDIGTGSGNMADVDDLGFGERLEIKK